MTDSQHKQSSALRKSYFWILLLAVGLLVLSKIDWSALRPALSTAELTAMRPLAEAHGGFAGSASCRECHEDNHASWSASWHRTMTQEAELENIIGHLNVTNLSFADTDEEFTLFERDNQAWFRSRRPPDHTPAKVPKRQEYPIVMLTGSHHQQAYWYPIGATRTLAVVPVLHLKEADRWVPRKSVFLRPPSTRYESEAGRWNNGCLECHTTGPLPKKSPNPAHRHIFDTQVAELGISCEACHGPGGNHVRIHENPDDPLAKKLTDHIVDPARLDHRRASQICGGCHSLSDPIGARRQRPYHNPGQDLTNGYSLMEAPHKKITRLMNENPDEFQKPEDIDPDYDTQFWWDGMVRVSGREYNGLKESACHTKGELSCLSCHALHQPATDGRPVKEWANDQLHPDRLGDDACLNCHQPKDHASPGHTHHRTASSGSRCYNCHMPHTTYGLLKTMRSHTITSPRVSETLDAGRPTACNLCHLDKTLEWTGRHLHEWFGQPLPELEDRHKTIATAALMALEGDAAQRAIVTWAMSWPPAVQASEAATWAPAYLSRLLDDPYDPVRYMAGRSLSRFPAYAGFDYDFLAAKPALTDAADRALAIWEHGDHGSTPRPAVLVGSSGKLDRDKFAASYARRNDRRIYLRE